MMISDPYRYAPLIAPSPPSPPSMWREVPWRHVVPAMQLPLLDVRELMAE